MSSKGKEKSVIIHRRKESRWHLRGESILGGWHHGANQRYFRLLTVHFQLGEEEGGERDYRQGEWDVKRARGLTYICSKGAKLVMAIEMSRAFCWLCFCWCHGKARKGRSNPIYWGGRGIHWIEFTPLLFMLESIPSLTLGTEWLWHMSQSYFLSMAK